MEGTPSQDIIYENLDILKQKYSLKLGNILYKPLSVENIESFADEALEDIIKLIESLLNEYENNPNFEKDDSLNKQEKEDDACIKLGILNITAILERILEVKDNIDKIKQYVDESTQDIDTVITPPDDLDRSIIPGDGNKFEKKKLIPRLVTLMYILEKDFGIDIKDVEGVEITRGIVTNNMVRKNPYIRVIISSLERVVYICDEEGNASYVFDIEKLNKQRIDVSELDIDGKQDKNSLIDYHPGIGIRIIQTPNWRTNMRVYLATDIPETKRQDAQAEHQAEQVSEFDTRDRLETEYLSYEEWSKEVKTAWDNIPENERSGNAQKWYISERKKGNLIKKWPHYSLIKRYYPNFKSLNIIVGKENRLETKWLSYEEWAKEVKTAWNNIPENERPSNVETWYGSEREGGRKKTWLHSTKLKKQYGALYVGLNTVVGKENHLETEYLSYEEWVKDVKKAWDNIPEQDRLKTRVDTWYQAERKKGNLIKKWPPLNSLVKGKIYKEYFKSLGKILKE
jgi:hypothetical protein